MDLPRLERFNSKPRFDFPRLDLPILDTDRALLDITLAFIL